jgi:hypothetical protein
MSVPAHVRVTDDLSFMQQQPQAGPSRRAAPAAKSTRGASGARAKSVKPIFPLKDVKFAFQRFSRYKLDKDAEEVN